MKKYILSASISLLALSSLSAKVVTGYDSQPTKDGLMLRIDSIDYRKDLTRIYGTLVGRPHTSGRIDAVLLNGIHCCDIDGVDFNRYFQWEDDGKIPVELDFPGMKYLKSATLQLQTPHGTSEIFFTKQGK